MTSRHPKRNRDRWLLASPAVSDVAVQDGKIAEVGPSLGPARREIDAAGLIVAPGFVDIHTHYDGQATWDPFVTPSSWHGVTTTVFGNCGVGFAPVRPGKSAYLINLMEGVEDIPGTVLSEGVKFDWESFPEYLDALDSMTRTVDVAAQLAWRAALLRHGRPCGANHAEAPDQRETRGDDAAGGRGTRRGRDGRHHLAHDQAQGARRQLHAFALSAREAEAVRAGRGHERARARHPAGQLRFRPRRIRGARCGCEAGRPSARCCWSRSTRRSPLWRQDLDQVNTVRRSGAAPLTRRVGLRPI